MTSNWNGLVLMSVILGLLGTGCTTSLNAIRLSDNEGGQVAPPPAGAPYSLPFTQYTITVTRRLTSCTSEQGVPEAEIAMSAEIARAEVPDPTRQYVIDLTGLQGPMKKTNLVIEYHDNGALKSINAEAEDRSAQVLTSVTEVLGTVVKAAAGVAAGPGSELCRYYDPKDESDDRINIRDLVEQRIPAQERRVKAAARTISQLTSDLERETALATTLGRIWAASDRQRMAKVVVDLHDARSELVRATEELKASLAVVTSVGKVVWPPNGSTFSADDPSTPLIAGISLDVLRRWLVQEDSELNRILGETTVFARITSPLPQNAARSCTTTCPGDTVEGIKYRVPQQGILELFSIVSGPQRRQSSIAKDVGLVSQLGPIYAIPLKSVPFSNREVKATFSPAGLPLSLGIKSNAVTEAVAASISSTATQASQVRSSVITTELERVQAQTALLTAQRQLQVAESALVPSPNASAVEATAAFQADTALLSAELAYLNALRALEEARRLAQ